MKNIVFICWDAPQKGKNIIIKTINALKTQNIAINTVLCLAFEHNFNDEEYKDNTNKQNTKERLDNLEKYYESSSIKFEKFIISEKFLATGEADNIPKITNAIKEAVFPKLINYNPIELHIGLETGTKEMIFSWISLYSSSELESVFGENIFLWHFSDDRIKKQKNIFCKLDVPKNPFIKEIELSKFYDKDFQPIELDINNEIKRNCLVNAPMLILGERGIGKSTIVETTIYAEKKRLGLIEDKSNKKNIQTILCGQLSNDLVDDELFGHAKGSFTGATNDKAGAIELANKGILFLDEIQDLPAETQRKLLRVLQKHTFCRLGEPENERFSDFQLVCASNKTLKELQEKLHPDFFDRIAVFVTKLIPLREMPEEKLKELWINRWNDKCKNGFVLPNDADDFLFVKDVLLNSKLHGNIRDIEQLIAYIARDVYAGTKTKSNVAKENAYKKVLAQWQKDYSEKYANLLKEEQTQLTKELLEQEKWSGINKLFKKWLAEEAEKVFGSQKQAASAMDCEPKTFRNAKG